MDKMNIFSDQLTTFDILRIDENHLQCNEKSTIAKIQSKYASKSTNKKEKPN